MIKKAIIALFFLIISSGMLASASSAGQVVTAEMRSWAKAALEQEKLIKGSAAPNTVAITNFNNKTEKSDLDVLQKGLAFMLITDLSKVRDLQVVERARIQAITEELGLGVSGLVEPGSSARVGRLLQAEYVIGGDILNDELEKFRLNSALMKVSEGGVVSEPSARGQLLEELFRMEKDLLFKIIDDLKIKLSEGERSELKKPVTENLMALMYMIDGIEHSDRGNYDQAADSYEKALKEDPNLEPAKEALNELQELGLIGKGKKGSKLLNSLRDRTSLTDQLSPEYPTKRSKRPDVLMEPQESPNRGEDGGDYNQNPNSGPQ
ncbi:Putative integral membrane protein (fragment) [uncultured Desulfobacterium sp.]|uniref:Integral membrane protein n=1 Tax=uncultured Desulfobacterium sp. TaxID=201089 RepID=A0A445N1X2_9BACT